MIPGFDIVGTVNIAVRLAFFVAGGAGALAVVKSVHDLRHGFRDDSYGSYPSGVDSGRGGDYGHESGGRGWFGRRDEGGKVGKEAEVQAREKQLFQDVVAQEIQEKELSRVMKALQEDMKSIILQTESARTGGFRYKEQHTAYMALWKNFYSLILSAENYLKVIYAKDLQLSKEFSAFVQDVNTRSKREGWNLKHDLKTMQKELKKIDEVFNKLRTGIFAVHALLANDQGLKAVMMDISALGTAGRFPLEAKDKIPPRNIVLEKALESLEKNWLKRMVDKHRPSLHTAIETYEQMVILTEEFAKEFQRVKAELELTTERKEMESPEAKAKEEAEKAGREVKVAA